MFAIYNNSTGIPTTEKTQQNIFPIVVLGTMWPYPTKSLKLISS